MSEPVIRRMRPEDVPQAAAMEQQIFSCPWSSNAFLDALAREDTLFLVAECPGAEDDVRGERTDERIRIAGYMGMYLSFEEGEIMNVAVHPDARRRGIARRMLEEIFRLGKERGIARFLLEVRVSNQPAIRLYEGLGFEKAGVRRGFYERPKEDAWTMIKERE